MCEPIGGSGGKAIRGQGGNAPLVLMAFHRFKLALLHSVLTAENDALCCDFLCIVGLIRPEM
jgi:hypothetical protein